MNIWEDSNNSKSDLENKYIIGVDPYEEDIKQVKVGKGILAQIEEAPVLKYNSISEKEFKKKIFKKLFEDIVIVGNYWYNTKELEKFNKFHDEKDI